MKIDLRGMWKIGSGEWWTVGRHTFCVSFPEWFIFRVCWLGKDILKAIGFYATRCGCYGKNKPARPMKFRFFRCKDCAKRAGGNK
jgi:hypothetical protein